MAEADVEAVVNTMNPPPRIERPRHMIERISLCLPNHSSGLALHYGDEGFREETSRHYAVAENNAAEILSALKSSLRHANNHDFWTILMEGMTEMLDSQYAFVAKRILVDDQDSAVEMPHIGEPGSCLMGVAFFYDDGKGLKELHRDYKYMAYGAPCAHMRNDKVFLIPERLNDFATNSRNLFPFPTEAYLGIPLFADGRCFAHFGAMWTEEALERRVLSWSYMELLLRSLEDLILDRILCGHGFSKGGELTIRRGKVIPREAVSALQSLRPYARSLSHELRTPMQGVVGMLDVMHATVQDAVDGESDDQVRQVFQTLKENIEVVQDSSKRAVEAADNVVQAYDFNLQLPDSPEVATEGTDSGKITEFTEQENTPPETKVLTEAGEPSELVPEKNGSEPERASPMDEDVVENVGRTKRPRSHSPDWEFGSTTKYHASGSPRPIPHQVPPRSQVLMQAVKESEELMRVSPKTCMENAALRAQIAPYALTEESSRGSGTPEIELLADPNLKPMNVRESIRDVIHEALRVGGRPDSAIAVHSDEEGERLDVRSRDSKGDSRSRFVEWMVDSAVPENILIDESNFGKILSCVFMNALKFTERGRIRIEISVSPKNRYMVMIVRDSGSGIPRDFLPNLFKPFTREDESLTRPRDGLGLGLLVAKGVVRKMGGDLACTYTSTSGPDQGTEFEIRVPVSPFETGGSIPGTPPDRTPPPVSLRARPTIELMEFTDEPIFPSSIAAPEDTPRVEDGSKQFPQPAPREPATLSFEEPPSPKSTLQAPAPRTPIPANMETSVAKLKSTPSTEGKVKPKHDRTLGTRHPFTILVAEDNSINRRLLVTMLTTLGYNNFYEAFDGAEAVRQMTLPRNPPIDLVLMDLHMPNMDGYEATEKILEMPAYSPWMHDAERGGAIIGKKIGKKPCTIVAVTADVTTAALEKARRVGMETTMTKPFKLGDLEAMLAAHIASVERDERFREAQEAKASAAAEAKALGGPSQGGP